jgi:hypothetical protein
MYKIGCQLTLGSVTSALSNTRHGITESLPTSSDDVASRVSYAGDALADGIGCSA